MSTIDDDLPPHSVASCLESLGLNGPDHAPRVLILYGSLREQSYSRYLAEESARVLRAFGS